MVGNLDMNNYRIFNLPLPKGPQQPVTLVFADLKYLPRNGTAPMLNDLNMDNKQISHLLQPTSDTDAANKKCVDDNKVDASKYLKNDGTNKMTGDLNMDNHKIFEFNHIDKSPSESDIKTLKDFYKHYYKKYWCFKKSYKRSKHLGETITISGICLMIIGTITGRITLNPIILLVVNIAGILVTNFWKNEKLQEKDRNDRNRFYNL